jgi:hypothetical protein
MLVKKVSHFKWLCKKTQNYSLYVPQKKPPSKTAEGGNTNQLKSNSYKEDLI